MSTPPPPPPRLELREITKRYPGVLANDRISLSVAPGEIHAVLGENGAGKSTLMKVIYGLVAPDEGEVRIDGEPVLIRSPNEARALGIAMVFQHFSLFETLTVAENVWLGQPPGESRETIARRLSAKAAEYGQVLDPDRPVHGLSVGERQRVEIVRALLLSPRLLILDEPTSVLTPQAVEALFVTLRRLAATGCSILYISHKLDEIRALCHRCTVLRAGRVTGSADPREANNHDLARLMIGSDLPSLPTRAGREGAVALAMHRVSLPGLDRHDVPLREVSLEVREGEILGIAGVSGNGQQALLAALTGEDARVPASGITLFGQAIGRLGPAARRRLGLRAVPEERLGRGAVPGMTLAQNLLLTRAGEAGTLGLLGWLRTGAAAELAREVIARWRVKAPGPQAIAASLSGGNLQKFIVGREIAAAPRVLVIAQPTWGVDVGAAAQIRAELLALRDAGGAIVLISEELDELLELSDRVQVIAGGRLSPSLPIAQATVQRLGEWMGGGWPRTDLAQAAREG